MMAAREGLQAGGLQWGQGEVTPRGAGLSVWGVFACLLRARWPTPGVRSSTAMNRTLGFLSAARASGMATAQARAARRTRRSDTGASPGVVGVLARHILSIPPAGDPPCASRTPPSPPSPP